MQMLEQRGLCSQVTFFLLTESQSLFSQQIIVMCSVLCQSQLTPLVLWVIATVNIHPETARFPKKGIENNLYEMTAYIMLECLGNSSIECPLLSMIEHLVPNNMLYLIREIVDLIIQHIGEIIIVTLSR